MLTLDLSGNGHRPAVSLPTPGRERWEPLRAGLVDIFLYDHEEFRFRDGKLLLRGNNGTGKSKVLALMLPFLVDGDLSPHRVEPDGDRGKRMEWNLLLGDRYPERLGYTWLELGRRDEGGGPEYLTLGCGLKAVQGRGVADHWFFVTSQRVGQDLFLIGSAGTTLTRDRLEEAIGERGQIFREAMRYRRAVDERLFRLGQARYDALISLLIQLRQPQLSRHPDERRLSVALTHALTPPDQAILSDVADAFLDLDRQRTELSGLQETRRHLDLFLERYRHYVSVASRRQAAELRTAQSQYEELGRQLAAARAELALAEGAQREATERRDRAQRDLVAARARERELSESRELKDLADAQERAAEALAAAGRATQRRADAAASLAERAAQCQQAQRAVEASRSQAASGVATSARAAGDAGLSGEHAHLMASVGLPDDADEPRLRAAERAAAGAAARREDAVRHVLGLVGDAERAQRALAEARRRLQELEAERERAAERLRETERAVTGQSAALAEAWRRHVAGLRELRMPEPETFEAALLVWAESLAGENPARTALQEAAGRGRRALAELLAAAVVELRSAGQALEALVAERERLLRGETARPPTPYTRAPDVRAGRPGAPLWEVIDFQDEVSAHDRAGLEAALEASGLLDAWVTPDGRLLEPGTLDMVVTAGRPAASNLGAVLKPAVDRASQAAAGTSDATVAALLGGIGLGAATADTWVEASGRWRLGVTEGQWTKPAATFVGRAAREAARRRRLAELALEIGAGEEAVGTAAGRRDAVLGRQRVLEAEVADAPDEQPLRDAHARAAVAAADHRDRVAAVDRQQRAVEVADSTARQAAEALDREARDLALPATRDELDALRAAVAAYRAATAALWPAVGRHLDRLAVLQARERDAGRAAEQAAQSEAEESEAVLRAIQAEARRDALNERLGAAVDQLRERLAATRADVGRLEAAERAAGAEREDALGRAERARGRAQTLEQQAEPVAERREVAVAALHRFVASGLLAVALPEVEVPDSWSPDPTVRLARRVEQALGGVASETSDWERAQRDFTAGFRELSESLGRHGHRAMADPLDDRYVVTVVFGGRERRPDELAALLAQEVEHRERLLSARERQVLEDHLVGEVASHLQERISEAETLIRGMNDELERRPTSIGMRLRFRWEPDPEGRPGLLEARRRLLRQASEAWSPEDRAAVSEFLQRLIAAERAADETGGGWLEPLTRALDYRAWHRFTIERWQDGRWRPASGPASGGERVLTVTLPLFAAASAHYRSAHPPAPRLVMLDEAFAGVDDDSRAKCLGLLAIFDLDLVMTSEREWACYPTVPGIAIHHLTRREGIDAIHVSRWEWDGATRIRVEPRLPPPARPM